jgi:hypothetical protein
VNSFYFGILKNKRKTVTSMGIIHRKEEGVEKIGDCLYEGFF